MVLAAHTKYYRAIEQSYDDLLDLCPAFFSDLFEVSYGGRRKAKDVSVTERLGFVKALKAHGFQRRAKDGHPNTYYTHPDARDYIDPPDPDLTAELLDITHEGLGFGDAF